MTVNLLEMAQRAIGSGMLSKVAGMLGEDETKTKSAMDIAGSALLGGLMKKVSSPQGAEDVFHHAKQFDTGMLEDLDDHFGAAANPQESSVWSVLGGEIVSKLLGNNQDSAIDMVSKLAGIGRGSSKSLLSMLAPLLFGMIAKRVKTGDLNLSSLINLVMSQKAQVAKYLPAEFNRQLGIAGLMDSTPQTERVTRPHAPVRKQDDGNLVKFLLPLAVVVGLGIAAWWLMSSPEVQQVARNSADDVQPNDTRVEVQRPVVPEATVPDATAPQATVPKINLDGIGANLGGAMTDLTQSIGSISDVASAQATIPQIKTLTERMRDTGFNQLTPERTTMLQGVLTPLVEKLQSALETAYQIPGVKAVLEPVVKDMMDALPSFVKVS
ncbi:DUF937 domain-containing protein [Stieleria sp. TO1_6]|uniref:DUF937 domain-containing protein n=1 Tax=Stieleria tagensis TaxID=2956795 RepID=UPI00209B2489|nr:DUF937 domain-containing protein [Stieleria tagensis]MCO8124312.1 DUF937 domain-containing protein [Stieleria tagensis]